MPKEIVHIATISTQVTRSLKIMMPRINVKMTDNAKKSPSERPKGFIERIYPIMSLDVRAHTKAEIMGRFEMNAPQNSPLKRLGNVLPISIFPFFNKTSPIQYVKIANIKGSQRLRNRPFLWKSTSYTIKIIIPNAIKTIPST